MIKISDFKNESSLDLFVQQIMQKKTNKYVAPVFKSLKEGIIENFFFNVLDNFYYLVQLGCFLHRIAKPEVQEEFGIYARKLDAKLQTMKKSEIMNFVRTKILVSDFAGNNEYQETFDKIVDKYFGIRITKDLIKNKYDVFNAMYFDGLLPHSNETDKIKFDLNKSNATRLHGNLRYRYNGLTGECYDYVIRINPNLKYRNEFEFDAIVIHEMIHLYCHVVLNDHSNYKGGHGYNFMRICDQINKKSNNIYNLNRYISHNLQRI